MRFGVNYVPARNWWHTWVDWEPGSVADDLSAIAALGMDHVRIQCIWPLFQPDPAWVSPAMLDRLATFMGLADEADLDVCVTLLDGWLSGMYLRPFWQHEKMNIFSHPEALEAQKLFLREVTTAVGDHPRMLGIDIANEPNVLTQFAGNTTTTSFSADAWTRALLTEAEQLLPNKLHVVGFDHVPWLTDSMFGRDTIATTGSMTAVHAWTLFTGAVERYGVTGTGTTHLGEYLVELANAFHTCTERLVWLQEYGASHTWMPPNLLSEHAESFTRAALSCPQLWGLTWWCSHDIDRRFTAFAELEYDLGLLTTDNTVKPAGERLRDLITNYPREQAAETRQTALVLPTGQTPDLEFADSFFALVDAGCRPTIIREESLDSESIGVQARGITHTVRP